MPPACSQITANQSFSISRNFCHHRVATRACVPARTAPATAAFRLDQKHGNRRLRPVLVECLWRLSVFQPEYRLVKKWRPELLNPKTSRPRRKKIIVAMARAFAVDWWRVRTGRCKAQDLGLKLQVASEAQNPRTRGQRITNDRWMILPRTIWSVTEPVPTPGSLMAVLKNGFRALLWPILETI